MRHNVVIELDRKPCRGILCANKKWVKMRKREKSYVKVIRRPCRLFRLVHSATKHFATMLKFTTYSYIAAT